jgi:hypothetical protein
MDAGRRADHVDEALRRRSIGQVVALEPSRPDLVPGDADQLEKPLPLEELAAREPGEDAALEDLDVRSRGVVLGVLLAIGREPLADAVLRVDARTALAVDEEVVLRHA